MTGAAEKISLAAFSCLRTGARRRNNDKPWLDLVCARTTNITYVPTWAGFLYLAVVLDAFSRRIWSMATTLATRLVLDALNMALLTRRPQGVIHHSDQGSQPGLKWSSQHLEGGAAMTRRRGVRIGLVGHHCSHQVAR